MRRFLPDGVDVAAALFVSSVLLVGLCVEPSRTLDPEVHRAARTAAPVPLVWSVASVAILDPDLWASPSDGSMRWTPSWSPLTVASHHQMVDRTRSVWGRVMDVARIVQLDSLLTRREQLNLHAAHLRGGEGLDGVARRYFGKSSSELTIDEAVFITLLERYGSGFDPTVRPKGPTRTEVEERANRKVQTLLARLIDRPVETLVPTRKQDELPADFRLRQRAVSEIVEAAKGAIDEKRALQFIDQDE